MILVDAFVDEGLGHSSFLVDLGDGSALVVDPPRIPDRQLDAANARGLTIAFTADTHSHADYVSGSPNLAAHGAEFLAPIDAQLEAAHHGVAHSDEIQLRRGLVLRAIATPGHTPDHLAYLLCEEGRPVALFSGGSLMVGTVGRTDLLGPELQEPLARRLYHALHDDILTLPDDVVVYPTHGAGSFCSAPGTDARTTTIGRERATNPLLQTPDEDAFVSRLVAGFGSFPTYFSRLPEVNRRGPRKYDEVPALDRLDVDQFRQLLETGAVLVDARGIASFSAGHIPVALSIELRPVFASWLGWLVDPEPPLVFVLDDDQDRTDIVRQCLSVGYENLAGELDGGMFAWRAAGLPENRIALVGPNEIAGAVVDVRQRNEYVVGHLPGSANVELGSIEGARLSLPAGPLVMMCGHGERAMSGASILAMHGRRDLSVLVGGPEDWATATGHALE
jgi:glyoxylase-like metal-dependent hydrolase (beta-lactamase superfamily II)/rhodanese-related sulfurtransferase